MSTDRVDSELAAARGQTILVDFDHTLFEGNSTEMFLASARPAFLASLVLAVVRDLLPWGYGSATKWWRVRDYLSVLATIIVMPWTLVLWRRQAPDLFLKHENTRLAQAIQTSRECDAAIISFGFDIVIRQLVRGTYWERIPRISTPLLGPPRRLFQGKLSMARSALDDEAITEAVFISDSENDADLLDAVRTPLLAAPVGAMFSAEERQYFPLRYTRLAKFPPYYMVDQFIFVDFLALLMAVGLGWQSNARTLLSCAAMLLSLFCVYEIGYFENDMVATSREQAPTLTTKVEQFRNFPLARHAWGWAATLGLLGIVLSLPGGAWSGAMAGAMLSATAAWALVLIGLRAVFWFYNRQAPLHRIWTYPVLQVIKSLGPLVVLRSTEVGVGLLSAQALTMWIYYIVYRLNGDRARLNRDHLRCAIFVVYIVGMLLAGRAPLAAPYTQITAVMFGWCVWRTLPDQERSRLRRPFRQIGRFILGRIGALAYANLPR